MSNFFFRRIGAFVLYFFLALVSGAVSAAGVISLDSDGYHIKSNLIIYGARATPKLAQFYIEGIVKYWGSKSFRVFGQPVSLDVTIEVAAESEIEYRYVNKRRPFDNFIVVSDLPIRTGFLFTRQTIETSFICDQAGDSGRFTTTSPAALTAHEFGHILGLTHYPDHDHPAENDIMQPPDSAVEQHWRTTSQSVSNYHFEQIIRNTAAPEHDAHALGKTCGELYFESDGRLVEVKY
ncbi:MAG: hypothetical protein AAF353_00170 [Pseudomonadota bacterium]